MARDSEAAALNAARRTIGLSVDELWTGYFALGGKADPLEFEAILQGLIEPEPFQYNLIVQVLNECLSDLSEDLIAFHASGSPPSAA